MSKIRAAQIVGELQRIAPFQAVGMGGGPGVPGGFGYLLRDDFLTDIAAGALEGTLSEPGPGTRFQVTDTSNRMDIDGDRLRIVNSVAANDPYLWMGPSFPRFPGRLFLFRVNMEDASSTIHIGLDDDLVAGAIPHGFQGAVPGDTLDIVENSGAVGIDTTPTVLGDVYDLVLALRASGFLAFRKGGVFGNNFKLVWIGKLNSPATLRPFIAAESAAKNTYVPILRAPDALYLPPPFASDGFGTVPAAVDLGPLALNGVHTKVGLNGQSARYDGLTSFTNIYSSALATAFNGNEITILLWAKVNGGGVWTDATARIIVSFRADLNNRLGIERSATNNDLLFRIVTGSVTKTFVYTTAAPTDSIHLALHLSDSGDFARGFVNGAQVGSTQTGIGTFVGSLASTLTVVGAQSTVPTSVWNGTLAHAVLLNVAVNADTISALYALGENATHSQIVSVLVANGYSESNIVGHWPLTEQYLTDGKGHAEGVAGGIGEGGGNAAWLNSTYVLDGAGKLINTPSGTEVSTDPGLEGTYTAGLNDSLTKDGTPTVAQSADVHGGSKAQEFTATAASDATRFADTTPTLGKWYRAVLWSKRTVGAAGTAQAVLVNGAHLLQPRRTHDSAGYTRNVMAVPVNISANVTLYLQFQSGAGPFDTVIVDDVSLLEIDQDSLFDLVQLSTPDAWVEADITFESSPNTASPTGVVFAADSQSDPQNYVVAFMGQIDGTIGAIRVALWKCVAGVLSQVMAPVTVTYVAGATLKGFKDGSKYRLYYNELAVGSEQTISDAGIIDNTLFGAFSTYEGNLIDNQVIRPRGSSGEYDSLGIFLV